MTFENLKPLITDIVKATAISREEKLLQVCQLLNQQLENYNWVGFYFANHATQMLHLGPYIGPETDHTAIPFGKGICGQVAVSNQNFVVPDVQAQDNYIACSISVKSEIVVPIFANNINIGQIDIDSNTLNAFSNDDEAFLEFVTAEIATLF
jgi:GAF domain-containing protein